MSAHLSFCGMIVANEMYTHSCASHDILHASGTVTEVFLCAIADELRLLQADHSLSISRYSIP